MLKTFKCFMSKYKLYPLFLIPIGLILSQLAKAYPSTTESVFSQGIYPIIARLVGGITTLLPFSLFEIIIIVLVAAALTLLVSGFVWLITVIVRIARKSHKQPKIENEKKVKKQSIYMKILCRTLSGASILYFVFVMFCGLNYYRLEFSELSGMEVKPSSKTELAALCSELIETANEQRKNVLTDSQGVMTLSHSVDDAAYQARVSINSLNKKYDYIFWAGIKPKSVINSQVMSYMNITGIFSPFTIEANVNVDVPHYDIPATMCHELVHTRGFMREDEANFIAYLICKASSDVDFQYSGTMLALVHSMNRLYDADIDKFTELYANYSEGVKLDFAANSEYWKQFEGKIAEVSSQVNDTYLKANSQEDGVVSYGRMVDLLLAERRERK